MKTTKRALGLSVLSLLLCAVMLIGTTFAWFTDSVINTQNKIQTGELAIQLKYRALDSDQTLWLPMEEDTPFFDDQMNWEPGKYFGWRFNISTPSEIENKLALDWDFTFQNIVSDQSDVDLADVLVVYVGDANIQNDLSKMTEIGTLSEIRDGKVIKEGKLNYDGQTWGGFSVAIKMKEDADIKYQGATVTFDIVARAKQAASELDGFGNRDYDKDAEFAPTQVDAGNDAVANGKALRSAIDNASENDVIVLDEGTYELDEALVFTKPLRIVGDGEAVLDLSNATAPIDGSYVTSAALFVASSNVTFEGVTIYGAEGLNSIVTVGFDNVGAAGLEDGNIKVSDDLSYDFEWAVNEFYPEYKGIYENVNFSNCTFALNDGASVAHGLFLNCRYAVIENCTFKNVNATSAIVKIEEDHTKVLGSLFENCTGTESAEDWCGAGDKGDGNEYPGHEFKCEEGWANLTGEEYEKHLAYAASLGWNHHAE